jgi:sugar lactone lactonase YvrE
VDVSQASAGQPLLLDAVEGMQIDKAGVVWMLDNGRRSEYAPKVVAWDSAKHKLHRVYNLAFPAVLPGSLLDDLAVDPEMPFIYMSDPAAGADAALVVLDLATGLAHRVLQGHPSVVPVAGLELVIDGQKMETRRLDGSMADPQGAVSALTLDKKGEWLYFAPVRSLKLYRVRTEHLRDVNMLPEKLAGLVEEYSAKPVSDGMSMDSKGNIYVSDLAAKGIGMISAGKKDYRILAAEPRLLWPGGLCFGADGWLYFFTNAARTRPPVSLGGPLPPPGMNYLFRLETPASGRVGD